MLINICAVTILIIVSSVTSFGRNGWYRNKKYCTSSIQVPDYSAYSLRISEQKCKEYLWTIDERENRRKKCKLLTVIRGQRTKPTEYPHMGAVGWMSLKNDWIFLCGSSLISENFVLTSAHCTKIKSIQTKGDQPRIVRLGVTTIYNSSNETPEDIAIADIIRHPKYSPPIRYYDIALLKLEKNVKFSKFIHPACLWTKPLINTHGEELTVTGWGVFDKTNKISNNLLRAALDLLDPDSCNNFNLLNRNWRGTNNHQLCAGKLDGSTDTCYGDSGGPLQYKIYNTTKEGTMHMIIGITTFGSTTCAKNNTPAVYTTVSPFIDWIESHVWPKNKRLRSRSLSQIVFRD